MSDGKLEFKEWKSFEKGPKDLQLSKNFLVREIQVSQDLMWWQGHDKSQAEDPDPTIEPYT